MNCDRNELIQIMAEVLGVELSELAQIGDDDDLRKFGFSSILMIKLIVTLEDKYSFSLDDDDLFLDDNLTTINQVKALLQKY